MPNIVLDRPNIKPCGPIRPGERFPDTLKLNRVSDLGACQYVNNIYGWLVITGSGLQTSAMCFNIANNVWSESRKRQGFQI